MGADRHRDGLYSRRLRAHWSARPIMPTAWLQKPVLMPMPTHKVTDRFLKPITLMMRVMGTPLFSH